MDINPIQPSEPTPPPSSLPGTTFGPPTHSAGQVFSPYEQPAQPLQPVQPPQQPPDPAFNRPMPAFMNPSVPPGPQNPAVGPVMAGPPPPKRRFSKRTLILAPLLLILVLGGSAAAYFGYYMPNKPQNILSKAVENTLAEHQFTSVGTIDVTSSGVSGRVDYTAKIDSDSHSLDLNLNTTISGVAIPLEVISAKGNVYFKVGDISSLENIVAQYLGVSGSSLQTLEDEISKNVTNQWIEVDSTLIKEAKYDCLTNYPAALAPNDIKALENAYKEKPFSTTSSTSTDTVNDANAFKYQLQIDDNKTAELNLSASDYFKKLGSCIKNLGGGSGIDSSSLKDNDKTPLTLWVDKKTKLVVKYASQTSAKDKADGTVGTLSGSLSYGKVNISAPANAKPVLDVLGELNFDSLFSDESSLSDSDPLAKDTLRKTDINALQGQIESYGTQFGVYPTLQEINDAGWRAQNMPGFDATILKDPDGTASTLVTSPAANAYSYQAAPGGCNDIDTDCTDYTLTATLSDGTTYAKKGFGSSTNSTITN